MIEEIWTSLKVSNFIIRHWTDCSLSLSFSWSLFRILRWTDSWDGLRLAVGRFSSERRSGRCNRRTRSVDKKKLSTFDQKLLRITSMQISKKYEKDAICRNENKKTSTIVRKSFRSMSNVNKDLKTTWLN